MIFEYGMQIKAFFHFTFKHFFEFEFGIRVLVEILIFMTLIYMLLKVLHKIIIKVQKIMECIYKELVLPLCVRGFEKLAFSTNNPNWQERANKIKDDFMEGKNKGGSEYGRKVRNKGYARWWFLIYTILVLWILGFHYYGEEKRNSYQVFFLGEDVILTFEEWVINGLFSTDEYTIECFFHDEIELD